MSLNYNGVYIQRNLSHISCVANSQFP